MEAGWTPEPVWTLWRTEKSLTTTGIRTPDHPVRSLVAVLTTLLRLPQSGEGCIFPSECSVSETERFLNYDAMNMLVGAIRPGVAQRLTSALRSVVREL